MTKSKYSLLFLVFIFALLFLNCVSEGESWSDDGHLYQCPECQGKPFLHAIGECERCGDMTVSISLKYYYDCAKELNCCQRCGIER